MNASFYDLLKYANTGIASPGMTYYDKMRALAMTGGGTIKTLTGIPPLSFTGNGKPLISLSMLGNGQQTGTPTPDTPITPEFVGVRTANLVDVADLSNVRWTTQYPLLLRAINSLPNGVYTMSISYKLTSRNDTTDSSVCGWYIAKDSRILSNIRISWQTAQIGEIVTAVDTFTIDDNDRGAFTALYLYGCGINGVGQTGSANAENIMLNTGSTALPYEPFGWTIPFTCAGQTVPVYLGEVQTTRQVKKLVLDGTENWRIWAMSASSTAERFYINISGAGSFAGICSHFPFGIDNSDTIHFRIGGATNNELLFWIDKQEASTVADFKSYLAAQYAAGTPVTVWYVLATPTTGIVNEPLAKIGDYADELHSTDAGVIIPTANGDNTLTVDTDLQPSSMTITGHIE